MTDDLLFQFIRHCFAKHGLCYFLQDGECCILPMEMGG
jgi:hypothetical protein